MTDLEILRYPIGPMPRIGGAPLEGLERARLLAVLEQAPGHFRALTEGLTAVELDQPYRPGGWTLRQVVHHVADSHLNSYVRMKLAITEDSPQVKTYDEKLWAELPEARTGPVDMSLSLIDALHRRWVTFLRALTPEQWRRTFVHPDWGVVTIDDAVTLYAWHCRHHAAHIESAAARV
jgi:hypothetical protein